MSDWYKTDTYSLARTTLNPYDANGRSKSIISPYDIPEAVRVQRDSNHFKVEFTYIPIEESRDKQCDENGYTHYSIGAKTRRLYSIRIDLNSLPSSYSENSACKDLIDSLIDGLISIKCRNGEDTNKYRVLRTAFDEYVPFSEAC